MSGELQPGRALVTGAGTRLGKVMAQALGVDGWAVGVHYRKSEAGARNTAKKIEEAGGRAALLKADLANEAETGALLKQAAEALGGPITLLVNSASMFENDSADAHSRESWDKHFEPNLRAPIHLSQQLAKALPKQDKALIINIIDQRVWNLSPDFFTYTLTKAALWTATQTMAQAFAPTIRVNAIGPGPTLRNLHQSAEEFTAEQAATLTQEGASTDEIVKALRYLISASAVTGQMIAVDGGQHLMWPRPGKGA